MRTRMRTGRPTATIDRARRAVTVGVSAMAVAALLAVPMAGGAQEPDEIRTTVEGLSGYTGMGEGTPMSVLLYDVTGGAIPTDPGEPELEATASYSRAILGTGPQSRATASLVWPGPAVGDGFKTICGQPECPEYVVKAEARYPEGPIEHDQSAPEVGSGMLAQAFGLDVYAQASSSNSPNESGAGFGSARSESTSTVTEEGVVVVTTDAAIEDVNIGDGVITIDSVRTVMTASSNGETAVTEGTTSVTGFELLGVPFRIDENGVNPGGQGSLVPPPSNITTPEDLGITIEFVTHQESVEGPSGRRFAGGLIISVDTQSFVQGLESLEAQTGIDLPFDPLDPPQTGLNDELDRELANAYVTALFPLMTASPNVRYVFGRARVEAAGSPPFVLPDFPAPPPPPPPATTTDPPPSTVQPPSFGGGVSTPPAPPSTGQPTQVAPPAAEPTLAGAPQLPDWFDGLPFVLFLLGAIVAGIGGYGLHGLSAAALGAGGSQFCESGAPKRVPDLRTG